VIENQLTGCVVCNVHFSTSKELLLTPVIISRNEKEKVLIEGSVNSLRISIAVKQVFMTTRFSNVERICCTFLQYLVNVQAVAMERMRYVHLLSHLCSHSPSTLSSITVNHTSFFYVRYLILIIGSVCMCHGSICLLCYFLAPCDKRKHTAHTHQQAASQAIADSGWRHPVWLPHSSLGFQHPVGRHRYRLTPQATIAQCAIVACGLFY